MRVGGGYGVPGAFMNDVPVTDCLARELERLVKLRAGFDAYCGPRVAGDVQHENRIHRIGREIHLRRRTVLAGRHVFPFGGSFDYGRVDLLGRGRELLGIIGHGQHAAGRE